MKYAVPVSGGVMCSHFGHCEQFALIQTENGQIKGKTMPYMQAAL